MTAAQIKGEKFKKGFQNEKSFILHRGERFSSACLV